VEQLRERLGWHDLERAVEQALKSRLSMDNCPDASRSYCKTGATHQRLKRCRVDWAD